MSDVVYSASIRIEPAAFVASLMGLMRHADVDIASRNQRRGARQSSTTAV